MGLFNADVEIPEDFTIPDSWKVNGSDNVTFDDYPRFKSIRRSISNDPFGFCHQVMRNLIARNPAPEGTFQQSIPHFNDFYGGFQGVNTLPQIAKNGEAYYHQWINCLIDYEDDTHPTCMKARWYAEMVNPSKNLAKWDDAREAGDMMALHIRQKRRPVQANYQPFKIHNPGAYEYNWILNRAAKSPEDRGINFDPRELPEVTHDADFP